MDDKTIRAVKDDDDFSDFEEYIPQHDDFEEEHAEDSDKVPMPIDPTGIDLSRPPGFVGRVADWIDSQCRYPRRKLAVASAIVAVGNIAGLTHRDTRDDATSNLIAFCVAASSSGKEAVMQAFTDLHIEAGMQGAVHGSIKSEQEIMRNVIDMQASFYNIDELGIFMTKVKNAQKRGGSAAYLEGVFGAIMSIFSKANGRYLLGGDGKRDLIKQYAGVISRAREDDDAEREEAAQRKMDMVTTGLVRPFMSIVGYTTHSTFIDIMDGPTATQGLLGRAIVVNEKDINPRPRRGFKKAPLPFGMKMTLRRLAGDAGGNPGGAVEYYGEATDVETDDDASDLLDGVLDWFLDYADEMNEVTGEASVAMIRRSFEAVAKISCVLGMADGRRTVEHVAWAFAYVKTEVDGKIQMVFANDNAKSAPEQALAARILSVLDTENGMSLSVLSNRLKVGEDVLSPVLGEMGNRGLVRSMKSKRRRNGKHIQQWVQIPQ